MMMMRSKNKMHSVAHLAAGLVALPNLSNPSETFSRAHGQASKKSKMAAARRLPLVTTLVQKIFRTTNSSRFLADVQNNEQVRIFGVQKLGRGLFYKSHFCKLLCISDHLFIFSVMGLHTQENNACGCLSSPSFNVL